MSDADTPPPSFSAQDALVALMVGVSASDEDITTRELLSISQMVDSLPVFDGFDPDRLRIVSRTVLDLFTEEDGIDALFGLVRDSLPESLYETAYALCCDVAAADAHAFQAELQFLLELRYALDIDRLHAAAIERVIIREVPSQSTRRALIIRGDADLSLEMPAKDTAELRKRPDLLFGEWDTLIDEQLSSALANPPVSSAAGR